MRVAYREVVFPGPLPGLNDFAGKRSRWHYKRMKSDVGGELVSLIRAQRLALIEAPVHVRCTWIEPSRRRDPDNVSVGLKFILDAMVTAGLLPGDGWGAILSITHQFELDPKRPRVIVTMWPEPKEA